MARSTWKGPFVHPSVLKKAAKANEANDRKPIRTWARGSTIIPMMVGLTFEVHNGQKHIPVSIVEDMIGHKLGEFAPTRIFRGHAANKKATTDTKGKK
ncbi:MAG: 30S ribosomal protein S19 [Rickettsiales bacterium]|jgi:small subunit ribosomal protein S19|nr:30S ribosomal protein S19 [Rickettsiales bacterium]